MNEPSVSPPSSPPHSLADTTGLFNEIAQLELHLAVQDARCEKRIAAIKLDHAAATAAAREALAERAELLATFIEANQHLFQEPRKVKTSLGWFGLQRVSDVDVHDEPAALAHCVEHKLEPCFKIAMKLVKTGVREALEAGAEIPGCALRAGDVAVYKVAPALVEEARRTA